MCMRRSSVAEAMRTLLSSSGHLYLLLRHIWNRMHLWNRTQARPMAAGRSNSPAPRDPGGAMLVPGPAARGPDALAATEGSTACTWCRAAEALAAALRLRVWRPGCQGMAWPTH